MGRVAGARCGPLYSVLVRADIGIIGGSGLYSFFADAEKVRVRTPFGELCLASTTTKPHRLRFVEFYPP